MTKQQQLEVLCLVYDKWAQCFDELNRACMEEPDGSPGLGDFHQARIESAIEAEGRWKQTLSSLRTEWQDCIPMEEPPQ